MSKGYAVAISTGKLNNNNIYIKLKSGAVYLSTASSLTDQHLEIAKATQIDGVCPEVLLKPTLWMKVR